MKFFDRLFLKSNRWVIFPVIFLLLPLMFKLLGFEGLSFYEETGGVSQKMTIGNPISTISTFLILSVWIWTLCNFFNNMLPIDSKKNILFLSKCLSIFLILLSILSCIAYYYAEDIFRNGYSFLLGFILFLPYSIYLYSIWFTIDIIKLYFIDSNNKVFLFPWTFLNTILFPISIWKLQKIVNSLYSERCKSEV